MHCKLAVITLWSVCLALWTGSREALADGGALRFSGRRGDRLISVFTSPTPPSTGLTDLSVLVQERESGRPITDLPVEVHAHRLDQPDAGISAIATTEAATNKLLRAASLDLAAPGRWHVDVFVQGMERSQPITFKLDVAEATVPWLPMTLWIAWPIVPIGLFAIHELRVRRRRRLLV